MNSSNMKWSIGAVTASVFAMSSLLAHAGSVSFHTSAPAPGAWDIYSFTAGATDADNILGGDDAGTYVAFDRGAQGQTFMTGSDPAGYSLNAIWLQWVSYDGTWVYLPPGGVFQARLTDPAQAGTAGFVLQTDSFPTTGTEPDTLPTTWGGASVTGAGTWLRFELTSPIFLNLNTAYGFDVSSPNAAGGFGVQPFFETAGTSADVFAGGAAYTSGPNGSGGDDSLTAQIGDRVFLLEITAVPEPSAFALGGLGLALLAVGRRRG